MLYRTRGLIAIMEFGSRPHDLPGLNTNPTLELRKDFGQEIKLQKVFFFF